VNKEKYREYCRSEGNVPIFSSDWWLDATCGKDNWDVVFVERDNEIVASLPFKKQKKFWFVVLSQPELTQKLGPTIKYPGNQKYEKRLSYEKKVLTELFQKLPEYDFFVQNFDYSIVNWLPMYWLGYTQSTSYTYVIEELGDLDRIWQGFSNRTRTDIRKAEKKVTVRTSEDIELFYAINCKTFERQGVKIPYSLEFVRELDDACAERGCRKIFFAADGDDRIHAAIYLVWDKECAYYLMGGSDPLLRSSGGMHLLIWEAIKFSSRTTSRFDFEGSMMEAIERFVRSFGAVQKPYFCLTKTNSRSLKIVEFLRSF